MQVQAISRNVRISPRKARIVADSIKQMPLRDALVNLHIMRRRAAAMIEKTLQSAIANAVHNAKLDRNNLRILDIEVAEGQAFKRYHASTRGRIHPYKKRSSHIRVVLGEKKIEDMKTEIKKTKKEKEEKE